MIKKLVLTLSALTAMDQVKITCQKDIPCEVCSNIDLTENGLHFVHRWAGSNIIAHSLTYHGECAEQVICKHDHKRSTYLCWHDELTHKTYKFPATLTKHK